VQATDADGTTDGTQLQMVEDTADGTTDGTQLQMVEDTTATDALLALTISLDRDDQLQLEDFNSRILEAWCSRIAQCLGTTPDDFRKDMLPRRTQGAKTETHRDLRSVVVWNFVDSFILSAPAGQASRGMAGAAIAMSLDRNTLRRYHRNCSAKESTLTKPATWLGM
jgi:hypothetical protein